MTSALLVVDVQNAVVDGIDGVEEFIERLGRLVERARAAGAPVVWVQHDDDDLIAGSNGWQLVAGLIPGAGDLRIAKQARSAFADTGLGERLRAAGVTHVVVTGAQSAFCVDMAGKQALAEGFGVTFVRDGHINGDLATEAGVLTDAQVRGLLNRTWSSLRHPGVEVDVRDVVEVSWRSRPLT